MVIWFVIDQTVTSSGTEEHRNDTFSPVGNCDFSRRAPPLSSLLIQEHRQENNGGRRCGLNGWKRCKHYSENDSRTPRRSETERDAPWETAIGHFVSSTRR